MLPWWWSPQRMMSNSVPEREKETLTGWVSFYTQWIDICVCIRVRGLHLFFRLWFFCIKAGLSPPESLKKGLKQSFGQGRRA